VSVSPDDALTRAVVSLNSHGTRQFLVLEPGGAALRGLIATSDIVRAQAVAVETSSANSGRAPLQSEPFLG
jgi:CBS domain-containing protein